MGDDSVGRDRRFGVVPSQEIVQAAFNVTDDEIRELQAAWKATTAAKLLPRPAASVSVPVSPAGYAAGGSARQTAPFVGDFTVFRAKADVARIAELDRRIAELTAQDSYRGWSGWPYLANKQAMRITELEAENARLRTSATDPVNTDHVGPNDFTHRSVKDVVDHLLNGRVVPAARAGLRKALDKADEPPTGKMPDGSHRAPGSKAFRLVRPSGWEGVR